MKHKVLGSVVAFCVILILLASAMGFYLLNGMRGMNELVISNIDLTKVENGTYIGEFEEGNRWSSKVSVTIYNHKFIGINIIKEQTFHKDEIADELISRIINAQSLDVDAVSGSTITSKGYLKAIENALR